MFVGALVTPMPDIIILLFALDDKSCRECDDMMAPFLRNLAQFGTL